jgi:hypothetical protein
LLFVSRIASTAQFSPARIFLAVMLTLVLLAGVAPLSSLSSSHECSMACCAGKPPHMAGSCSVAFDTEEEAGAPDEANDEHSAHAHMTHTSGATTAARTIRSTKHHERAKSSSAHHSTSGTASKRAASITSQATVTTPCSPECAAAATASVQLRRPRDAFALTAATMPRPSATRSFAGYRAAPLLKSAESARLSQPRAPPALLINLSA